jgi:Na+-driven multidrug efflux pump
MRTVLFVVVFAFVIGSLTGCSSGTTQATGGGDTQNPATIKTGKGRLPPPK